MFKKAIIMFRTGMKIGKFIILGIFLIFMLVVFFYKPIYRVSLGNEQVGYTANKSELQKKINEYMEKGNGEENLAFVQVNEMPEYKMCLLKRGIVTNDEEIFEKVKEEGINYYQYYAVLENGEEKLYVSNFEVADQIISKLKEKDSGNIDSIAISEVYDTKTQEFTSEDSAISSLYIAKTEQEPEEYIANNTEDNIISTKVNTNVSTSRNMSYQKVSLGVNLIRPISGTISSRFGSKSSVRSGTHTGLDIAAPKGTPISAAASGTVVFSGEKGAYGKMIAISHANGIQTYYGHCSKLYVKVGEKVKQGDVIAAVGSTGNSTGPHLHLEIRINGIAYNPQNYLY